MYDTVVASVSISHPLDESQFKSGVTSAPLGGVPLIRMWLNPDDGYAPRVTYWRKEGATDGRLRVEFSIPKMAGINLLSNPTEQQKETALDAVDAFMSRLSPDLLGVRAWTVQRVDYAWNFPPSDELPAYLSTLSKLWCGNMTRHPYPNEGVMWKGRKPSTRWVKLYDKTRELGFTSAGEGVLRFEVSNYRRVLPYMCAKWFGSDRSVASVLLPGRALYTMAVMWERLGLSAGFKHDADLLLMDMRRRFGRGAASAFYAYTCIQRYGTASVHTYRLLSHNSYYTWRRTLAQHGYLTADDTHHHTLETLHLPAHPVYNIINESKPNNPQNLRLPEMHPAISSKKISWVSLADFLGLIARQPSTYLLERWATYEPATIA